LAVTEQQDALAMFLYALKAPETTGDASAVDGLAKS
jgi:hypothetical protein